MRLQTLCKIVNDYIHEACRDYTERTSDGTMRMKLRKYKPAQLLSDYQKLYPEDVFQVSYLRKMLEYKMNMKYEAGIDLQLRMLWDCLHDSERIQAHCNRKPQTEDNEDNDGFEYISRQEQEEELRHMDGIRVQKGA